MLDGALGMPPVRYKGWLELWLKIGVKGGASVVGGVRVRSVIEDMVRE